MKFSFEDENIDVSFKIEGLSKELKAEVFSTIYNSIKLEQRENIESAPKEKTEKTEDDKLFEKFKEGYNALPKGEDTFHYPESEFEKDTTKKPSKSKAVSSTKQKYEKKRPKQPTSSASSTSNTSKQSQSELTTKKEPVTNKKSNTDKNPYKNEFGLIERKIQGEPTKLYQLWYQCEKYGCVRYKKGAKQFVKKGSVYVDCEECGKRLNVKYATDNGFGEQDEYGNYYIAGRFERNYNAVETLAGTAWN